jgi:hypothetical protein
LSPSTCLDDQTVVAGNIGTRDERGRGMEVECLTERRSP